MEIRRHTEAGLHVKSTRWISASNTRTKDSTADIVTQSTATFARKVPAAYFLPICCKDALVTDQIRATHEFLKSDLHVHLGLAQ